MYVYKLYTYNNYFANISIKVGNPIEFRSADKNKIGGKICLSKISTQSQLF